MSQIRVPLTGVTLGDEEAAAAARVVRSGWVTMGAEVRTFESEFARALGVPHAVAVTNGTAALHLAYEACGLREGDEFIVPALTFVATLNAGLYLGARPILADCASEDDLTISATDVARKISPRTRLVVSLPYGGFPPDMDGLLTAVRDYAPPTSIPGTVNHNGGRPVEIVEDACHAPLAQLDGRSIGSFGAAGAFSFFSNKNMATGEGGMIVTARADIAERVRLLRSHGMTTNTWDRYRGHASVYDVVAPGYNYRMDEIRAAIGREQLKKLAGANRVRARLAAQMRERLELLGIDGLKIPFGQPRGTPVHHLFVVLLPPDRDREQFRSDLLANGVQTSIHYPPLHSFSHTRDLWYDGPPELPVLDRIAERLVTLPLGPTMTDAHVAWVVKAVGEALGAQAP